MVAVLEVAPEERPVLCYALARVVPPLLREGKEDQEAGEHLAFARRGLDEAPAGPVEVELVTEDIFALGIRLFSAAVDLEEYWLDQRRIAAGLEPAEQVEPEVVAAAAHYFPEIVASPNSWSYRLVEPAFTDLGFKLDRLLTAAAPNGRALYNKARHPIVDKAISRRRMNAEFRDPKSSLTVSRPILIEAPLTSDVDGAREDEAPVVRRSRPAGTALQPAGRAAVGLSTVARATYPYQYGWGVETDTGVNADELEPGRAQKVNVGGVQLMLADVEGKVCAAARVCPHRGWDLTRGPIVDGVVTCNLHGAQFDFCSGAVLRQPYDPEFSRTHPLTSGGIAALADPKKTTEPLDTYPTKVADDGEISIRI